VGTLCRPAHRLAFSHPLVDQVTHCRFGQRAGYPEAIPPVLSVVPSRDLIAAQIVAQIQHVLPKSVYSFCIGSARGTQKLLRSPVDRSQTVQGGLPMPIPHLEADSIDLLTEQFGQDRIGIPDNRRDPRRHLLNWPETHADMKPIENPVGCLFRRSMGSLKPFAPSASTLIRDVGVQPLYSRAAFMKAAASHIGCCATQAKQLPSRPSRSIRPATTWYSPRPIIASART
jgi:hypothetical protein